MEQDELEKRHYYREIARHFFLRRGGPFLLSSRDLDVIAKWEEMKIPLQVVLEGIERSYERLRRRGPGIRLRSLAFCDLEVRKAFAQYRDRLVGRREIEPPPRDKRQKVFEAVEEFLARLPASLTPLRPFFLEARDILAGGRDESTEERLEALEEKVERQLLTLASEEERQAVEAWVRREFRLSPAQEIAELIATALLQSLREKYRVPHLLTCYY